MKRFLAFICFFAVALAALGQSYQYDSSGRITGVSYSDGSSIAYTYDAAGNCVSQTFVPVLPPVLSGQTSAMVFVGQSFNYQITAANAPNSYNASGLPAGLTVNSSTGLISGVASGVPGTYVVTISAANDTGTAEGTLTINLYGIPAVGGTLAISTAVNQSLSYQIVATNSPGSFNASGLPVGLSVDKATGVISGVIGGSPGTYGITLAAANGAGVGTNTLVLTVAPPPAPSISSTLTAAAIDGQTFYYQITGSSLPSVYNASGLPPGLTINPASGIISGVTSGPGGVYRVTIVAANSGGTGSATLVVNVTGPPIITSPLSVSTSVYEAFSYQVTATNSPTTYNAAGLPNGLSIDPVAGVISGAIGMPAGVYNVSLSVSNLAGEGAATLQITVGPPSPPVITSANVLSAVDSNSFTYQIAATDSPTSYNAVGLPAGLSINSTTGLITGTPTGVTGNYDVLVSAANSGGVGTANLNISLLGPPAINSALSVAAVYGQAFDYQISATSNAKGFNATGLPAGLSINSVSGVISGTVTGLPGTYGVSLFAANQAGTGSSTLTIKVNAPPIPVIANNSSGSAIAGQEFLFQITATNNPSSYNAVGLPAGLVVNSSTGLISGVPSGDGGIFVVTLAAANLGGTGTAGFTLAIQGAPAITSPLSVVAIVGKQFSYQITTNNTALNFNATGLPPGLSINTSTGVVSGVPTGTGGNFEISLAAANLAGEGEATLSVFVIGPPVITSLLSITSATGQLVSYQIGATNSPTSYNAPGLPAGLSVNQQTGLISGTIVGQPGTYGVSLTATNLSGTTQTTLKIVVSPPPPPGISSSLSIAAIVGQPLSYQITGTNTPSTFNASGLPPGLGINTTTGAISGTPTGSGGNYAVTIAAANLGGTGTATLLISVLGPPVIPNYSPPSAIAGQPFSFQINGSFSPTAFNATGLPPGLSINTTTGVISGVPSGSGGNYGVSLAAANAAGTGTNTLTILVTGAPTINSTLSISTAIGRALSYQIGATFSPTSYNASGLPPGLSVNMTTGVISGTPVGSPGTYSVTLATANAAGKGGATLTIIVAPPPAPVVTSSLSAIATVGYPWAYQIQSTNTPTSYNASGLPPGLIVSSTTGLISGTPTGLGETYLVSLVVSNAGGLGESTLTLSVVGPPVIFGPLNVAATAGIAFSYQVEATFDPTSFNASGLPLGLSINLSSGVISGTPTVSGHYIVSLSAANAAGTGLANLAIDVADQDQSTSLLGSGKVAESRNLDEFIAPETTYNLLVGEAYYYIPEALYQSDMYTATNLPPGLSIDTTTGAISGIPTETGTYVVSILGTAYLQYRNIEILLIVDN